MSNINELLQELHARPEATRSGSYGSYDYSAQRNYDVTASQIRALVRDGEIARMETEAVRNVMVNQATQIAELQAEVARLERTEKIKVLNETDIKTEA